MRFADALSEAVKQHPDKLQALKRNRRTADVAKRIEEHAYGRASKVTKRRKRK